MVQLPEPKDITIPLSVCIRKRRSVRAFKDKELTWEQISNLLWAAQGITDKDYGFRAAPSAGATYPLYIYLVRKEGLYLYHPEDHSLEEISKKDLRRDVTTAALHQGFISQAPAVFVICARYERTTNRYGDRGIRYVHIEVGHAAQNLHLMAVGLGLGSVPVGAFYDAELKRVLKTDLTPLYIIPVGYPR
ncbi:nitroreductase [candidate division WOR-3 bacterium]|uniref:Nitroreductase n=1 Tax=candidate division WOR-3 bacterium TaxID=2052148 RepID=A0A660SH44_UNCW3|nr:MAG: nitroreductase [candidate division WOR-3 bacterium]